MGKSRCAGPVGETAEPLGRFISANGANSQRISSIRGERVCSEQPCWQKHGDLRRQLGVLTTSGILLWRATPFNCSPDGQNQTNTHIHTCTHSHSHRRWNLQRVAALMRRAVRAWAALVTEGQIHSVSLLHIICQTAKFPHAWLKSFSQIATLEYRNICGDQGVKDM